MNRSDETLFDPRIADWLEDDPNSARPGAGRCPCRLPFDQATARLARAVEVPRYVFSSSKLLALAAAVAIMAVGGAYLLGPRLNNSIGVQPSASTSAPSSDARANCGPKPRANQPATHMWLARQSPQTGVHADAAVPRNTGCAH